MLDPANLLPHLPMNLPRLFTSLVASRWFAALIFFVSMYVGINVFSIRDARDISSGQKPHADTYVVIAMQDGTLRGVPLREAPAYRAQHAGATFLLPAAGDFPTIDEEGTISFSSRPLSPDSQLIEATLQAETSAFIRYTATSADIQPQYTRIWYHGFMFASFPYALVAALVVHLLGRILYSRSTKHRL